MRIGPKERNLIVSMCIDKVSRWHKELGEERERAEELATNIGCTIIDAVNIIEIGILGYPGARTAGPELRESIAEDILQSMPELFAHSLKIKQEAELEVESIDKEAGVVHFKNVEDEACQE